jgi:hypothetical protein
MCASTIGSEAVSPANIDTSAVPYFAENLHTKVVTSPNALYRGAPRPMAVG